MLLPSEGAVTWDGVDITRSPQALRQTLGYLPQNFSIYPPLTARELLCYIGALKRLHGAQLRRQVAQALETVSLVDDADRPLKGFSSGMIRRIGIAQALLSKPDVLLLDEPTAGLDPVERRHLSETLAMMSEDRLVIISTHLITDIEAVATELALLDKGRLIWKGTPAGLLADAAASTWQVTLGNAEFEQLRRTHVISASTLHGVMVEARLIAETIPHPLAVRAVPTLEEAYRFAVCSN